MFWLWISLFIILVIIEICTVNLVSIWFAFGSLVTCVVSLFTDNSGIQIGAFVISSIIFFILTKPVVKKIRNDNIIPTNLDMVIGKIGIVTEDISKLEPGEVKVDGKRWTAVSSKKIKKDSKVEILSIDGVKLNVKEIKEEN